jgi:hypothetical protein
MQQVLDAKQRARHQRAYDRIFYAGRTAADVLAIPMIRGGAGSYPDAPSRIMPIDANGTIGLYSPSNPVNWHTSFTVFSNAQMQNLNDENDGSVVAGGGGGNDINLGFIFPELWEIDGHMYRSRRSNFTFQHSGDATNLGDGTWNSEAAVTGTAFNVRPDYRDDVVSVALSNKRAVRFNSTADGGGYQVESTHLYGTIAAGETPDRLLWFDDGTDLEFAKPLDYGDIPRGSASDYVTYLKNNSASLAAGSVQVTAEALYLTMGSWFTFSEGGAFSATLALASSIGAAANSPNITVRRIVPDAAALGLYRGRVYANTGSWT